MAAKNLVEFEVTTLRRQIEQAWKPHHKNSSNRQRESYQVYKSPGAAQPHTAAYLRMRKELKKEFPTQGRTTTNKEGIYSKPEASKAKDHKKERVKEDAQ